MVVERDADRVRNITERLRDARALRSHESGDRPRAVHLRAHRWHASRAHRAQARPGLTRRSSRSSPSRTDRWACA